MPNRSAHLAQAEHNETLYSHLDQSAPTYADWQVTSLFYAALHYVDAYLASSGPMFTPIRMKSETDLSHRRVVCEEYRSITKS